MFKSIVDWLSSGKRVERQNMDVMTQIVVSSADFKKFFLKRAAEGKLVTRGGFFGIGRNMWERFIVADVDLPELSSDEENFTAFANSTPLTADIAVPDSAPARRSFSARQGAHPRPRDQRRKEQNAIEQRVNENPVIQSADSAEATPAFIARLNEVAVRQEHLERQVIGDQGIIEGKMKTFFENSMKISLQDFSSNTQGMVRKIVAKEVVGLTQQLEALLRAQSKQLIQADAMITLQREHLHEATQRSVKQQQQVESLRLEIDILRKQLESNLHTAVNTGTGTCQVVIPDGKNADPTESIAADPNNEHSSGASRHQTKSHIDRSTSRDQRKSRRDTRYSREDLSSYRSSSRSRADSRGISSSPRRRHRSGQRHDHRSSRPSTHCRERSCSCNSDRSYEGKYTCDLDPPIYDGKENFDFFLSRFKDYVSDMEIHKNYWKQHLLKALHLSVRSNPAALDVDSFLRNTPTRYLTYMELVTAVKENLTPSTNDARRRLQRAEQQPEETLDSWHRRIYYLYQEIVSASTERGDKEAQREIFETARAQFLHNLCDSDLQLILSTQYRLPQDFISLLHFAQNGEQLVQEFRKSLSNNPAAAKAVTFADYLFGTSTSGDDALNTEATRASSYRGSRGGKRVNTRRHRRGSDQNHSSDDFDHSGRMRSRRSQASEYEEWEKEQSGKSAH